MAENITRWRLILGQDARTLENVSLSEQQSIMDSALSAIYDGDTTKNNGSRKAGLGSSAPNLAKWLTDVRTFFPQDVVSIIQSDAIERKGLTKLLFEPETLKSIKPDISMVGTLMALKGQIPEKSKEAARQLVKEVVDEIMKRMEQDLRRAVTGALNKKAHSPIANFASTDWKRTINRNLKNYDTKTKRLIPEKFYFFERSQKQKNWTVILDIDQSGSMCDSIIYSSVMGSIFASMPALDTHVVAFDTQVTDLTELCKQDPVDMLFGVQLGGGTDINKSVAYCQSLIENPRKTMFILISDLYEGGVRAGLLRRLSQMHEDGVKVIVLLALSDSGKPDYDEKLGKEISKLGIACFACTPDKLPELVEASLKGHDLKKFETSSKQQI
ncbi:VWA domain-containing protein [Capnocytophaga felis]|uniref:VWA domain-containing protein n=1 Tax=Capnocytophaga felis TaxID=2267611 RepID=A0A5M4B6V7_9FLAO|nr:VWA domain-containing protein [Capnocytophaga felis]GET44992.1 VWA domain-containing protein [Capnocytophaga felis]GET47845.1 VWA domain-containing protein [Capnocytophaga felis]